MSSRILAFWLCVVLAAPLSSNAASEKSSKAIDTKKAAADAAAAADDSTADADSDPKAVAKFKGRLPSGWGKIGVTDFQRQNIYKIQSTYAAKLDALKKELDDLETKRDAEMRKVLTAAQLKRLDELKSPKSAVAAADPKEAPAPAADDGAKKSTVKNAKASAKDAKGEVGAAKGDSTAPKDAENSK